MKLRYNKNFNISKVAKRLVTTILALWVGGTVVNYMGQLFNCTTNAFNKGFTLIGWTVTNVNNATSVTCGQTKADYLYNVVTDWSSAGVLAVVGIVGISSVVLEFVTFK